MGMTAIGGFLCAQTVSAAVTAAQTAINTVLATLAVPGDASIVEIILTSTDLDTNGSPAITLDVGDASGPETPDDDRFIAASTVAQAGGTQRASTNGGTNGLLNPIYTYSTTGEQEIEVTVKAAAATGAAGTVTLTVIYFRN